MCQDLCLTHGPWLNCELGKRLWKLSLGAGGGIKDAPCRQEEPHLHHLRFFICCCFVFSSLHGSREDLWTCSDTVWTSELLWTSSWNCACVFLWFPQSWMVKMSRRADLLDWDKLWLFLCFLFSTSPSTQEAACFKKNKLQNQRHQCSYGSTLISFSDDISEKRNTSS